MCKARYLRELRRERGWQKRARSSGHYGGRRTDLRSQGRKDAGESGVNIVRRSKRPNRTQTIQKPQNQAVVTLWDSTPKLRGARSQRIEE